ncbi:MAG: endopolygalacturonase [Chitinivibrionales bacterium]|nr:endopolygalacturonase [Chitinivibrionales bacterium]
MKKSINTLFYLCSILIFITVVVHAYAENIVFPPDAGIVDVTQYPFNAPNDGVTDATDAIQTAINICANKKVILYFPNGVYLISGTLQWGKNDFGEVSNPYYDSTDLEHAWAASETIHPKNEIVLQGQSTDGTIIRLAPGTFTEPTQPKPAIYTGEAPAQRFRNSIKNMTIDIADGNTGAFGVQFNASNTGTIRDVKIINNDRQALIGLDMAFTGQIGPCLIKNVHITGFGRGIKTAQTAINSITFENITLEDQVIFGFLNLGQTVSIRGLVSNNDVTAVSNTGLGFMVLIDCILTGTGDVAKTKPAITNATGTPVLFARNIQTTGYDKAIYSVSGGSGHFDGPDIDEYVSHPVLSLFDTPQKSLNLSIEDAPEVPWDENFDNWVSVSDFGALPDDGIDDAGGIQAAIDYAAANNKTTVYFPHGHSGLYDIHADSTVTIHGASLTRLIGTEAALCKEFSMNLTPAIEFGNDAADVVIMEHIDMPCPIPIGYLIHFNSSKTLVMSSCGGNIHSQGTGKIFLENHGAFQCYFSGDTKVFARGLNIENTEYSSAFRGKICNDGAQLWILGFKTERDGIIIKTTGGGFTELLGGFSYSTRDPGDAPMFTNESSVLSVSFSEIKGRGNYDPLVAETRLCTLKTLAASEAPVRYNPSHSIPLYVGYETDASGQPVAGVICPHKIPVTQGINEAKIGPSLSPRKVTALRPAGQGTPIALPKGVAGFELFDLQGRKVWEYRRVNVRTSTSIQLPQHVTRSVTTIKYIDK